MQGGGVSRDDGVEEADHRHELPSVERVSNEHHPLSSQCLQHQCGIEAAHIILFHFWASKATLAINHLRFDFYDCPKNICSRQIFVSINMKQPQPQTELFYSSPHWTKQAHRSFHFWALHGLKAQCTKIHVTVMSVNVINSPQYD